MIRNIEDEKKRINRQRHDCFSGKMSEETLMELISQVEAEEMLHAPRQLKENIFTQIGRERQAAKKRRVFAYRAKVFVAMAAAMAVLIFMPDDHVENIDRTPVEQTADEDFAKIAEQRQKDIDEHWERYLAERERGGLRGLLKDVNGKITEFGAGLYENISGK